MDDVISMYLVRDKVSCDRDIDSSPICVCNGRHSKLKMSLNLVCQSWNPLLSMPTNAAHTHNQRTEGAGWAASYVKRKRNKYTRENIIGEIYAANVVYLHRTISFNNVLVRIFFFIHSRWALPRQQWLFIFIICERTRSVGIFTWITVRSDFGT